MESNDHDLMVKIHTQVERLIVDVKEIKDDVVARLTEVEDTKASSSDLKELSASVEWLKRIAYSGIALLGAAEFYFSYIRK